ncbi:snaclec A14-like [Branchiostoma floridae]|uniref:Snaclec A14-like n=1 Tax=Branchiostoma floridae TaxID=7739 RepID=A0A9J7KGF0_BRAFL|nr:snaclec A14-like [Branchiostoma floridae]
MTAYTEGDERKMFQATFDRSGREVLHLAIAVHAKVVRLTPHSRVGTAAMDIGLLGCPIKEQRAKDLSCGKGWRMFEERCYQKFPSPLVWWAAERYCQALGGHLAAVNTLQENKFLRISFETGWIGMKLGAVILMSSCHLD